MSIRSLVCLITFLVFGNCSVEANNSHAFIKGWTPGSYGSYSGVGHQASSLPIWVRIDFDQKPGEGFVGHFFPFLIKALNPSAKGCSSNVAKHKLGGFCITVQPSVTREQVQNVIDQANRHFDPEFKTPQELAAIESSTKLKRAVEEERKTGVAQKTIGCLNSTGLQAQNSLPQSTAKSLVCNICLNSKDPKNFCSLTCCGSLCCRDCLMKLICQALSEKTCALLKCPDLSCRHDISRTDLAKLITDESNLKLLESIQLQEQAALSLERHTQVIKQEEREKNAESQRKFQDLLQQQEQVHFQRQLAKLQLHLETALQKQQQQGTLNPEKIARFRREQAFLPQMARILQRNQQRYFH